VTFAALAAFALGPWLTRWGRQPDKPSVPAAMWLAGASLAFCILAWLGIAAGIK
jgi:hypothetical protein